MIIVRERCSVCGAETDWDYNLGESPLCAECWDAADPLRVYQLAQKKRPRKEGQNANARG